MLLLNFLYNKLESFFSGKIEELNSRDFFLLRGEKIKKKNQKVKNTGIFWLIAYYYYTSSQKINSETKIARKKKGKRVNSN